MPPSSTPSQTLCHASDPWSGMAKPRPSASLWLLGISDVNGMDTRVAGPQARGGWRGRRRRPASLELHYDRLRRLQVQYGEGWSITRDGRMWRTKLRSANHFRWPVSPGCDQFCDTQARGIRDTQKAETNPLASILPPSVEAWPNNWSRSKPVEAYIIWNMGRPPHGHIMCL